MSKIIEIKVPVKGAKQRTVEGQVAWFQLGNQRIKFFIQNCGLRGVQLTHFGSGLTIARPEVLAAKRIDNWAGSFNGCISDREACRQVLGDMEKKHGLPRIFSLIAGTNIINK